MKDDRKREIDVQRDEAKRRGKCFPFVQERKTLSACEVLF